MVTRVHHVNFLVRDLDAAIARYEKLLGMPVTFLDRLEGRGVDLANFKVGDTWIVLVHPTEPDTIPARHLEEHGEGFFLISYDVDSLNLQIADLGEEAFDGPARSGMKDWRVRDVDMDTTFGAQVQYVEETGG